MAVCQGDLRECGVSEIRSYRDLKAWQKAMELSRRIYAETKALPREEAYGLTAQIRRAAVSVPANIAEGWGRNVRRDYLRFLRIARGSVFEVETLLILAADFGYFASAAPDGLMALAGECARTLQGLIRSLEKLDATSKPSRQPAR